MSNNSLDGIIDPHFVSKAKEQGKINFVLYVASSITAPGHGTGWLGPGDFWFAPNDAEAACTEGRAPAFYFLLDFCAEDSGA